MYFNGTKCLTLLYCAFVSSSLMAKDVKQAGANAGFRKPLCFVENKGQVVDEENIPRNDIQYQLSTPGMDLYVGDGQLHYQYKKVEDPSPASLKVAGYRMDVTLAGANPNAKVTATEKQEYYENYYIKGTVANGITVHAYHKITYKDVYPNIDWVLYVKDNKVEYDFVVRPGGNVADIKLQYDGATALNLDKDGSLLAKTPMGDVTAKKPYAYETATGKAVASNFALNGNTVTFKTGDHKGSLTIDPYLLWSTYYGGTAEDVVTSVKETTGGNTFIGGYTASTNAISRTGAAHGGYLMGTYDAFLAKFTTTTGAVVYATYFGGANNDQGTAIAIDNTGSGFPAVYLVGYTSSTTLTGPPLTTGGAFRGAVDGFVAKFTNAGTISWDTYYGGPGDDYIYAVTCDAGNNVYIAGQTASATGIATTGAYQTSLRGTTDAFVARLNSTTGGVTWSTYYGGTADEQGLGIVCDPSGNVYVTGQTNSITGIATADAFQAALSGTNDAFMASFNSAGAIQWGTYFGGVGTEQGNGIAYDAVSGNIAIVGNTTSTSGIATANACQQVYGGGTQDAFLSYFTTAGNQIWSTYYGGPSLDYGQAVCFDPNGNLIIAGGTFSSSGIASAVGTFGASAFQNTIGGDYDAFVAKLNPLSQSLWGTYFGGTYYDYANSVFCNSASQITIAGYTASTGLYRSGGLATSSAPQTTNGGGTYDGFVSKFNPDTLVTVKQVYADTLVCAGGTLLVPYAVNFNFQAGNVFSVQMSDITGSFAAPVTIGTVTATTAGSVTCTIPSGTTPGTGYRIRVTSSSPVYISPDDYYNITVVTSLPATTATGTTPSCVGNTIYFYDNSPAYAVASYAWSGPLGFTSTLQNPTLYPATVASAGVYSVATTHNGCPSVTSTVSIVVNTNRPPMPADSASSPNCLTNTLYLFSNPDTVATGIVYHWSGPAGFTSSAQNPSFTATATGTFTYIVTDSLAGCPSVSNSVTVTVLDTTHASITISANPGDTICAGTLVTFSAIPSNGGATPLYQWMSGVASPIVGARSSTFASATLEEGETIFCELSSSITCPAPLPAKSNAVTMNVIDNPPIVDIYASTGTIVPPGTTVTFTSAVYDAGVGAVYQWQLNGNNISGANNTTLVFTTSNKNDTISLMVTSSMNCAIPNFDVSSLVIVPTTSVANVAGPFDNIALFPNPNNGSFTIQGALLDINTNSVALEIMNPLGLLVYTTDATVQNNELNKSIDLSHVADGIYLVRIQADQNSKVFRIMVWH